MSYQAIVPDYASYLHLQTRAFASYEGTIPQQADGQRYAMATLLDSLPRSSRILDLGCGDGVGLVQLRKMGFADVEGLELNPRKALLAQAQSGFIVDTADMHEPPYLGQSFDVVWCSHALNHAYDPARVLREVHRILRPGGLLFLILPYPDTGNDFAHGGKYDLGTAQDDRGTRLMAVCRAHGMTPVALRFDALREPEVWLTAVRT